MRSRHRALHPRPRWRDLTETSRLSRLPCHCRRARHSGVLPGRIGNQQGTNTMIMDDSSTLPIAANIPHCVSAIAVLAEIPEEEIWLSKQKSAQTRRAYRLDVLHFMRTLSIAGPEELRLADHKAVIAWERYMREVERVASSTIRRRLAALSSLYKHLVRHGYAARNPVGEVERPAINRDEGATAAFSKAQARKLLDLPGEDTISGCAIARFSPSVCRSGCGAPKSRRSRSATCTRTAAMIRCARRARAAAAMRSRSIRRRLRGFAPTSRRPGTAPTSTGRCSGRSSATASVVMSAAAWTPTRLIAWCGNTPLPSVLIAATRHTRCGRPSSRQCLKTALSSKTCKRRPGTATRAQPSCMIGVATTPRRRRASSPHTEHLKT